MIVGIVSQAVQSDRDAQQGEHAVADQVGRGFLSADHRHDAVGDDLLVGQAVAVDLGGQQRVDQPSRGFVRCCAIASWK